MLTDDARLGLFGRWPPFPVPTAKLEGWLSAGLSAPRPETASNETPAFGSMGGRSLKWAPALVPAGGVQASLARQDGRGQPNLKVTGCRCRVHSSKLPPGLKYMNKLRAVHPLCSSLQLLHLM
jgi:hypothetical protein